MSALIQSTLIDKYRLVTGQHLRLLLNTVCHNTIMILKLQCVTASLALRFYLVAHARTVDLALSVTSKHRWLSD